MSTKKHRKNQATITTLQHTAINSGLANHVANKKKKPSKSKAKAKASHHNAPTLLCNSHRPNSFSQPDPGIVGMCNHIHRGEGRRSTTFDKYARLNEINGRLDQRIAEGVNLEPKQFSEALEILKLKRRLFLQRLQFAQEDREKVELFLGANHSRETENSAVKNRHDKNFGPRPSNKIVILRPAAPVVEIPEGVFCSCSSRQSRKFFKSKGPNGKHGFFFFKEIKKRWISSIVLFRKNPAPKRIILVTGGSDKSDEKEKESPDIFHEAKKHLSERLRNVTTKSEILEKKQTVQTLGRILCSPDHDLYTPASLRWNAIHDSVSTGRRFSGDDDKVEIFDSNDIGKQEDLFTFEVQPEAMNIDFTGAMHSPGTSCEGDGFNHSLLASPSHDRRIESLSGDSSLNPVSRQEEANTLKDGGEHQSPVSVLEPLFMEDANSPTSIVAQSPKGSLQPRRIDFEEYAPVSPRNPKTKRVDCMSEDESISAYVRAVLQTRPSPEQFLDAIQTKTDHDPELVIDCVNDVLVEAYERHFGCSPWTTHLKPCTSESVLEDRMVSEVVKDVKCLLVPKFTQPTLNQLCGDDIAKSGTWIDLRVETEGVVYQITEDIIDESVEETILLLMLQS